MTASVIVFHDPRLKAWTGQHLAEFQRVAESLERVGIDVDCEFGLTDEGDPWFVICDASTSEVLIHFARIDARYIAAVTCLGYRLEGPSLPRLACESWIPARFGSCSHAQLPPGLSGDIQ